MACYRCDDAIDVLSALPSTRAIGSDLVAVHRALHPETGQELVRLDHADSRRLSIAALLWHPSGARVCAFGHTHHLGFMSIGVGYRRPGLTTRSCCATPPPT